MRKIFVFFLIFSLSLIVYSGDKRISLGLNGGVEFPLQPNINDGWSDTYLDLPYLYTIDNRYNDSISTAYGVELTFYFLKNSGIYISYETSKKSYNAKYVGKYPNPTSPNILRTLEVEDTVKFDIYESSIGFKLKYVDNKTLFGETSVGITVFQGTPTFMKDMNVSEYQNHKYVLMDSIYFFDDHYHTVGLNVGISLYKKIYKGFMFGIFTKYVYGNFKIEKEERDDFIVPLQSLKMMVSLNYSF